MDKKKKIVFKINRFPQLSETFIVAQLITAKKLGFEVYLLVNEIIQSEKLIFKKEIDDNQLLKNIIFVNYRIPKNKIIRLLKWTVILLKNIVYILSIIKYYKRYNKFSLTYLFELQFYKQFNDFEIIHIQFGNHKNPIDKLKSSGFLKPASILTFHGHDAFFPMYGHIPNNGYYDLFFKYGDLITVNTGYLEEKVIALGCPPDKIKVIPVGVDTSYFYPHKNIRKQNEPLRLITVGRLDKIKGQKHLIPVVSKLLEMNCNIKLMIIGEGTEYDFLKRLIKDNNLDEVIILTGRMTQKEIRVAFQNSDIYLFTAVSLDDGRCETQGLATLEAQATGIPAVVFDSGGVKYTVEDNASGYICKEMDLNCVVNKIKHLYDNPQIREKMGVNAIQFVRNNFSQDKLDMEWNLVYNSFVKNKNC